MAFSHFVEFKAPQMTRTKERLFLSLNRPLEDNLYRKVCRDLDGHVKKLLANREHRLTRGQKSRDNSGLPTLLDTSGKKYISDMQKARILGEYFASVFSSTGSEQNVPDVRGIPHIESRLSGIFFHPEDVRKMLERIKPSTSETYDGIPQIVYKKCASSLCLPLTHIFNISMILGEVPDLWKEALVTAIPKSPKAANISDVSTDKHYACPQ
ncbi:hypothetical protein COOONC_27442 [Cooperia oncophora]